MIDASFDQVINLPAGASITHTSGFDTGNIDGQFSAPCELLISVPALSAGQIPDGKTIAILVEHDTDSAFGTVTTLEQVLTLTGAGGVGCAAASIRYRLPTSAKRFVRLAANGSNNNTGVGTSLLNVTGRVNFL